MFKIKSNNSSCVSKGKILTFLVLFKASTIANQYSDFILYGEFSFFWKQIIISLFKLTAQLSSTTVPTEKVSSKTHKNISLFESALYSSFNTLLQSVEV